MRKTDKKTNRFNRALAGTLAAVMVLACFCATAMAAPHPETGMEPTITVTSIAKSSFYKIQNGVVVYSDIDDGTGWTAVPSAYITGSEYNKGNIAYGAFVVGGEVKFVPLSECHRNGDGSYEYYHGTADSATISEDVDQATNQDPTMGTDFYLNIQNGIDPDGENEREEEVIATTADNRISYEITIQTKSAYQLNATVPAFVCMYGYRGSGDVVTPTSDAYKLKNYSTVNFDDKATVVDIVKLTQFSQILDTEHSDEKLAAIAFNKNTEQYVWWYSMPADNAWGNYTAANGWIVNKNIAAENLNASGECYVIYVDGEWRFKASGVLDNGVLREEVTAVDPNHLLSKDLVYGSWNFGKDPVVGEVGIRTGKDVEGLALKVTEIQAVPATWRLVDMATAFNGIKRGEIAMSIAPVSAITDASAIDLSTASAPIDITERGWFLAAPAIGNDFETVDVPTELGLTTNARIAGGNVNAPGCTSVVRVIYTLTPMFDIDDGQTGTVAGDAVNSNR